jgi:hypothetical protein
LGFLCRPETALLTDRHMYCTNRLWTCLFHSLLDEPA